MPIKKGATKRPFVSLAAKRRLCAVSSLAAEVAALISAKNRAAKLLLQSVLAGFVGCSYEPRVILKLRESKVAINVELCKELFGL